MNPLLGTESPPQRLKASTATSIIKRRRDVYGYARAGFGNYISFTSAFG